MSFGRWAKFELPRESIQRIAPLSEAHRREGAWKAYVLVESVRAGAPGGLVLPAGALYSLIKVPALEGTEIWVVEKGLQAEVERDAGFDRESKPLAMIDGRAFSDLSVLDPEDEEKIIPIRLSERT